jgi:hypothetical protein
MKPIIIASLLGLSFACSSNDGSAKFATGELEYDEGAGLLRVDIHPDTSSSDGETVYLTQSLLTSASNEDPLDIVMKEAVRVSGTITGWEVTPWLTPNLPGSDQPIEASVAIVKADSSQSYFISADTEGKFETLVVPDSEYALTITPYSPGSIFTTTALDVPAGEDVNLDLNLGYGKTLWGRVVGPDGAGISDVGVYAEDTQDHRGQTTYTNATGYYSLRVEPGSYFVNTIGRIMEAGRDPTLRSAVTVEDESDQRQDFSYTKLATHSIGGRVVGPDGNGIDGVSVVFDSTTLTGYDGENLSAKSNVTTKTNNYGNFDTRLAPGTYSLSLLPQPDSAVTGLWAQEIVVDEELSLGVLELDEMVEVQGVVEDPLSISSGSRIQCDEAAPGLRYWSTLSGEDPYSPGRYTLNLPASPVSCTVTPPGDMPELAITRASFTPEEGIGQDFTMATGTPIFGVVTNEDEEPFAFALVQVYTFDGRLLGTGITDSEGNYSVSVDLESL